MPYWQFSALLFVLTCLVDFKLIESAPAAVSTSTTAQVNGLEHLHTTLGSADFSAKHRTLAANIASLTGARKHDAPFSNDNLKASAQSQQEYEQHKFDARLVISNSRPNLTSEWGLTQLEAATACQRMASSMPPLPQFEHHAVYSDSPMSDYIEALRERILDRFRRQSTYKIGNLLEVDNMIKFELLNRIYYRFIPYGTFWTGGKLVEKDGHYVLQWLKGNATKNAVVADFPRATKLLHKNQKKIDKLAKWGRQCLVLKRPMPPRFPFSRSMRSWIGFDDYHMDNYIKSSKKFKWALHPCHKRLPYICVLHNREDIEVTGNVAKIDQITTTPSIFQKEAQSRVTPEGDINKFTSNHAGTGTTSSVAPEAVVIQKTSDEPTPPTTRTGGETKSTDSEGATVAPEPGSSTQMAEGATTPSIATSVI